MENKPIGQSMKKGRFAAYILFSLLIHTGFLVGAYQFLKLPAAELEPAAPIPVEVVVLREESPALLPGLTPGEEILTKKALVETPSQILTYVGTAQHTDDITEPEPQVDNYEPRMTVDMDPTLGTGGEVREGEEAASGPMVSSSRLIFLHISAVKPLPPAESAPLEVKMPAVLVETKAEVSPAYPQSPAKAETLLRSSPSADELVFELQPIAMKSHDAPRLNVDTVSTLGFIPVTREGETVAGKPIMLASQIPPLRLSPVEPSPPAESDPLAEKMPAVLVETKAEVSPAYPQSPAKVEALMRSSPSAAELVFELQPISRESNDAPRLNAETDSTLGFTPVTREGETVAGKPIMLASQIPPLRLSPVEPSPPAESAPLAEKMPAVLVETKVEVSPAYRQTPTKFEKPLTSRRPSEDYASELDPIIEEGKFESRLMVKVDSRPSGAQVYVEGTPIGETPLIWELPLGKHEIRLALPDYWDSETQIEVTESHKTLPILFRLLKVE